MKNNILESETIRYRILLNGKELAEKESKNLAEHFVTTLSSEQQKEAVIVPIADNGQEVLFG